MKAIGIIIAIALGIVVMLGADLICRRIRQHFTREQDKRQQDNNLTEYCEHHKEY